MPLIALLRKESTQTMPIALETIMRATIMNNQQCAVLPNYSKFGKIGSFASPLNKI